MKEEIINKNKPLISDFNTIIFPIITEKAMLLSKKNKITFKVNVNANKITIKRSIERIFNVKIKKVSICNVHSKIKTRGGRKGKTNNYKKAIVTVSSGNINFFDENKK